MEASSCVSDGGLPRLVKARISLGPDRCNVVIPNDAASLSEKLVELKRQCMDCISSHLLAHNALAAADSVVDGDDDDIDPFQEDIADDGEEEAEPEQAKEAGEQQKKRSLKQKK